MTMELRRQRNGGNPNDVRTMFEGVTGNPTASRDFNLVRPVCVQVMTCPTVSNLHQLSTVLAELSPVVEPCLLDYIVYPLSHHLKLHRKHSEEVRIALHSCTKVCLKKWEMETFPCFAELYQFCMMSLCTEEDPGNYDKSLSEEITEHVVTTLHTLIDKSVVRHRKRLYSDKYIAAVGHGVCILLQIVNMDTTKSLRINCIKTVSLLIKACRGDADACHRVFKFLPGLATSFVRCCAIKGGRYQVDLIKESLAALEISLSTCISFETVDKVKLVDSNILFGLIEISETILTHDEARLRKALADFSLSLLQETNGKLPDCSEVFWNNVLILCSDDDADVSAPCITYLKTPDFKARVAVMCNYTSTLYDLRKALVQRKIGEDQKCNYTAKKAAASFLVTKFKPAELRTLVPRLIELMSTCIRLDIEIRKETYDDVVLTNTCKNMCHWIAETHNWAELLNIFSEIFEGCNTVDEVSSVRSSGAIKCFNEILSRLSSTPEARKKLKKSVTRITARYIGLLNVLPKTVETAIFEHTYGKDPSPPVKVLENPKYIQANAVHNSCILEGLAVLAKLDPDYVTPEVLPRILDYAGNKDMEYLRVSRTAVKTLDLMRIEAGLTMKEYMHQNLDLIMSDIGVRVTDMTKYPHTADAMVFLADHFDFSQSTFVQFVEQIFNQSNRASSKKDSHEMFCRIFYAFILSIWKYYYENRPPQQPVEPTPEDSFLARIRDYQNSIGVELPPKPVTQVEPIKPKASEELIVKLNKLKVGGKRKAGNPGPVNPQFADAEGEVTDSDDEADAENTDANPPVPPEISLSSRIANSAVSHLPSPDRAVKLLSMDILIKGVQVLQVHENSLLPLAHLIWQNLVARFAETDYVIVRKAFDLLLTICTSSGTFLKRRTVAEVMPVLASYLKSLGEQSRHIDSKSRVYYTYTQAYKLQMTMLKGMAQLCKSMEIDERDMDRVVSGAVTYLPPDQHVNLREAAKALILELGSGPFGSAVWMKILANEVVELPKTPPTSLFKVIPPDLTLQSYERVSGRTAAAAVKKKKGSKLGIPTGKRN